MDTSAMTHAMKDSISEVLEQMFFLPIEFLDPAQPPPDAMTDQDVMVSRVGFNGSVSGSFRLMLPTALASAVTADFMGVQPGTLTEEQVAGTVKEMVNMLAGNALSAYAPDTVFDLHLPEMFEPGKGAKTEAAAPRVDIGILTEESGMRFQLMTHEEQS